MQEIIQSKSIRKFFNAMEDDDAWLSCHHDDLWIFDKCILSRKLGYTCGPADVDVPESNFYIVRPCVNLPGMGRGAEFRYLTQDTTDLPPGHFWCEIFEGRHLSVDFNLNKKSRTYEQGLTTEGFRHEDDPMWKFNKWIRVNDEIEYPMILSQLNGDYECINCEFIGDKLIEVHLRANEDMGEYTEIIPVWEEKDKELEGYEYHENKDFKRLGFNKK